MTEQEKLNRIYEVMANKIEKEGCQDFPEICGKKDENGRFICKYCQRWGGQQRIIPDKTVMIGDVLDWIEKKWDNVEMKGTNYFSLDREYARICKKQNQEIIEIVSWWKLKRLSINEQDDDCIDYVFNLLPK